MGRRVVSSSCHLVEQKNGDFVVLWGCHPTERNWMEVGRMRWRLISRWIVLFPIMTCSSINQR
ncbi:unnamed protein product [Spirodela intermedia]|uniref:Uncharacterized protein n=1 Tax=Spirodela intermedia TaxID=51605 RepID=A0ABN7EBV7_SPIIN|nr:unnamed protein product [Spirodela intermedia]